MLCLTRSDCANFQGVRNEIAQVIRADYLLHSLSAAFPKRYCLTQPGARFYLPQAFPFRHSSVLLADSITIMGHVGGQELDERSALPLITVLVGSYSDLPSQVHPVIT